MNNNLKLNSWTYNRHIKIPTQNSLREDEIRGATSIIKGLSLYISALSNNKLHYKVCAPNFHCFKFIFKISPLSLLPTTCSQSPQAPWRSKIVTFLICWTYFNTLFFLCQDFFTIFLIKLALFQKLFWKSQWYSLLLHRFNLVMKREQLISFSKKHRLLDNLPYQSQDSYSLSRDEVVW